MRLLAALALAFAAANVPVSAETAEPIVATTHPAAVALALRERGYRAKLSRGGNERPEISSGVGGLHFDIVFYGCKGDGDCTGVLFTSGFDLSGGLPLKAVNEWNSGRLVGRGFLDADCDPFIDHYVSADPEMSSRGFDALLEDWQIALGDFADYIGYSNDAPRAAVANCSSGNDAI